MNENYAKIKVERVVWLCDWLRRLFRVPSYISRESAIKALKKAYWNGSHPTQFGKFFKDIAEETRALALNSSNGHVLMSTTGYKSICIVENKIEPEKWGRLQYELKEKK